MFRSKSYEYLKHLGAVVSVLSLLPFIAGLLRYRKIKDRFLLTFFIYCASIVLIEALAQYVKRTGHHNLIVYNFYLLVSFFLVTYIIRKEGFRWWLWFFIPGLLIAVYLHISNYDRFNAYYYFFVFTAQSVISALALLKLVDYEDDLFNNPRFWIYSGLLLYGFTTVSLHLMNRYTFYLVEHRVEWAVNFYFIYKLFLSLVTYILFSRAFYVTARS